MLYYIKVKYWQNSEISLTVEGTKCYILVKCRLFTFEEQTKCFMISILQQKRMSSYHHEVHTSAAVSSRMLSPPSYQEKKTLRPTNSAPAVTSSRKQRYPQPTVSTADNKSIGNNQIRVNLL